MTREESAKILVSMITDIDKAYDGFTERPEIKELIEKAETATKEEQDKLNEEYLAIVEQVIVDQMDKYNLTPNQAKEILLNISTSLINEYNIPKPETWVVDTFTKVVTKLVELNKDDAELCNSLLMNDDFMGLFPYHDYLPSVLVTNANDKDAIRHFLHLFTENCKSDKEGKGYTTNTYLINLIGIILKSDKYDDEYKDSLLNDPELYPFFNMEYLLNAITASSFPKEKKLAYLKNPKFREDVSSYSYTKAILEICTTKEDIESLLEDEEIIESINWGLLLSSMKLHGEDLKAVLFNEIVQKHAESYHISNIIANAEMDYETRRSILFDERIKPLINATFLTEILASKHLTKEQRLELLTDERIYKYVNDGYNFEGIIPTIIKSKDIPIEEKLFYVKDDRFNRRIDAGDVRKILSDPDISIEQATELLLNKKLFYKLIGEYHEEYNPRESRNKGPFKYDKYEFLQELLKRNPYLAKTVSYSIFNDDMIDLGIDFIDRLSRDAYLCEIFANNYTKNDSVRRKYVKNAINTILNSRYSEEIDLSEFITRIMDSVIDFKFDFFDQNDNVNKERKIVKIRNDSHLNYDELTEENWKTLTAIAFRDLSPYVKKIEHTFISTIRIGPDINLNLLPDVDTKEDLDNYEERRRALCDEVFKKALETKDLESAKNALFNKYFNINYEEAIEIVKLYGHSIDEFKNDPKYTMQVKYVKQIDRLLKLGKLDEVKEVYESPIEPLKFDENLYLDQSLKRMYSKQISDSVYKVHGEQTEIEVNGQKVKVYEPGLDFKMLVHSTDAYGKLVLINNNYDDSWNKSSRTTNHGICCSLIANNNMGLAAVNDVLFGFDSWDPRSISKMAPYDIYSVNDSYDLKEGRKMIFMTADEIINNTRHAHNEMVLERRELRKDRQDPLKSNIQPSYVIIYSDMADEIKEKAIKCSNDMNIPIVYIDKEKISNNEVAKIDSKIQEIKDCHDLDGKMALLSELLIMHENNRSGYKITNPDWLDSKFPTSKIDNVIKQLVTEIKLVYETTGDIATYYKYSERLMRVIDEENQRFITTEENSERKHEIDLPVDEYKNDLMHYINPDIGKTNIPILEYIIAKREEKGDEDQLSRELSSIGRDHIHKQIEEIKAHDLYQYAGKSHNVGHIERVMVFATLIGREVLKNEDNSLDEHAIELLTKAALYHDCGRENDQKDKNHGIRSSLIAEELLRSDGYSEEDIKIIKVAIEYHEVDDDDLRFERICAKNGLDTHNVEYAKKIATCLKDADALDRTRFKNGATLNPNMLRTSKAKQLVDLATELNEEYEQARRKLFRDACKERLIEQMSKEANKGGIENDGVQR